MDKCDKDIAAKECVGGSTNRTVKGKNLKSPLGTNMSPTVIYDNKMVNIRRPFQNVPFRSLRLSVSRHRRDGRLKFWHFSEALALSSKYSMYFCD